MRPRKHQSRFRMTDYRVLFNNNLKKKGGLKNVKYVFKGSQDCGLMVTRTHRFMVNSSAAVNTNTGLIFSGEHIIDIFVQTSERSSTPLTWPMIKLSTLSMCQSHEICLSLLRKKEEKKR